MIRVFLCYFWALLTSILLAAPLWAQTKPPMRLGIYYGWPSTINWAANQGDPKLIARDLQAFDLVVLGANVENPFHQDYLNTIKIIKRAKSNKTKIFGYITVGNSHSFTEAQMGQQLKLIQTMGLQGVLIDEAGYEYRLPKHNLEQYRARVNKLVRMVHDQHLPVILNLFEPEHLFGTPDRPVPTELKPSDYYLYESYIYNWQDPYFKPQMHMRKRQQLAWLKNSLKLQILGLITTQESYAKFPQEHYDFAYLSALREGLDGLGIGHYLFSAQGIDAGVLRAFQPSVEFASLLGGTLSESSDEELFEAVSFKLGEQDITLDYFKRSFNVPGLKMKRPQPPSSTTKNTKN